MPRIDRFGDVVQQREQAYALVVQLRDALAQRDAEISQLRADLRDAQQTISAMQEPASVGREVMARFGSRADLDEALGGGSSAATPGAAPILDPEAWRASQMGGMFAPILGFRKARDGGS